MSLRACIFDQDGTMFDTERLYGVAWRQAVQQLGLTPPVDDAFHDSLCGTAGELMLSRIRARYPSADPASIRDLAFRLCFDLQNQSLPEKPGLREILSFLQQRGLRLAIGSSSVRAQILRNLASTHLAPAFEVIISGEDITHSKPHPECFLKAAAALHLNPSECCVFEDSANGVRAAHDAGCLTIMIPDRIPPTPEIRALADAIFPSFHEAMQWLEHTGTLFASN